MSEQLLSSPICPWCSDEADDTPLALAFPSGVEAPLETFCGGCEMPITIRRVVTVTYACDKRPVEEPA